MTKNGVFARIQKEFSGSSDQARPLEMPFERTNHPKGGIVAQQTPAVLASSLRGLCVVFAVRAQGKDSHYLLGVPAFCHTLLLTMQSR